MTQPFLPLHATTQKTWSRIGNDEWDQMKWFVKLSNTTGFETMTPGARLMWEEEFVAIYLRTVSTIIEIPKDKVRYPRSPGVNPIDAVAHLPSPCQMQEVRNTIAPHLDELADDKGTIFGGFPVELTISFHINPAHEQNPDFPRYLIFRGEIGGLTDNIYRMPLLLRMSTLLEKFADKVRRCKHCKQVFLQLKRSAQYCGPKCYTVGCMREFRAARVFPKKNKNQDRITSAKGEARHGKKRR